MTYSPNINDVTFGIEFEAFLPHSHPFQVGSYHHGIEMRESYSNVTMRDGTTQDELVVPSFNGIRAKCESDSSLRTRNPDLTGVELITPILKGEEGRQFCLDLIQLIKDIGGKVGQTCGQHIHIGLESITGTRASPSEVTMYLAQLIKQSANLQYAGYAQTGANRQSNHYSAEINQYDNILRTMNEKLDQRGKKHGVGKDFSELDVDDFRRTSNRGSFVNLTTIRSKATCEFRWAAGTLNKYKFLSHLFTCEYIARRAWRAKGYPSDCTKLKGHNIHRGDLATQGQRSLNYLVNQFRNNQDGKAMFKWSEIYQRHWHQMWSTSMRMARKWDKRRSGEEQTKEYTVDPKQSMIDAVANTNFTWF
jgi:hypothetical protein